MKHHTWICDGPTKWSQPRSLFPNRHQIDALYRRRYYQTFFVTETSVFISSAFIGTWMSDRRFKILQPITLCVSYGFLKGNDEWVGSAGAVKIDAVCEHRMHNHDFEFTKLPNSSAVAKLISAIKDNYRINKPPPPTEQKQQQQPSSCVCDVAFSSVVGI